MSFRDDLTNFGQTHLLEHMATLSPAQAQSCSKELASVDWGRARISCPVKVSARVR